MTEMEMNILMLKGAISELPEAERRRIEAIATTLRNILKSDPLSGYAFALVAAEHSARPDPNDARNG